MQEVQRVLKPDAECGILGVDDDTETVSGW